MEFSYQDQPVSLHGFWSPSLSAITIHQLRRGISTNYFTSFYQLDLLSASPPQQTQASPSLTYSAPPPPSNNYFLNSRSSLSHNGVSRHYALLTTKLPCNLTLLQLMSAPIDNHISKIRDGATYTHHAARQHHHT